MQSVYIPYHALILLLTNVGRYLAIDLARTQRHRERFGHIGLNLRWYGSVFVSGTDPDVSGAFVLKLARPQLGYFGARDQ